MEWLESLGLLGLFIGSLLAASLVPFSSDVLYVAVLAATGQAAGCFISATLGSWAGSILTYYIGWLALLSSVPIIGDILVLALGFYRTPKGLTFIMLLIGKALRFLFWNLIVGLF